MGRYIKGRGGEGGVAEGGGGKLYLIDRLTLDWRVTQVTQVTAIRC